MKQVFLIAIIATMIPASAWAQGAAGDPAAGAAAYRGFLCYFCHGDNGEGGFGPDLAGGRGLTLDQFRKAIRQPWGVMLSFNQQQLSDEQIAGMYAFLKSKPPAKELGHWHWPAAPTSAPYEQRVYMQVTGCSQCHEPENKFARAMLGAKAKDVDFEYFKKTIYDHTSLFPKGRMGSYSPERLSEGNLRAIYKFMVEDLGLRASMSGAFAIRDQQGGNTNYAVTVTNTGLKDKGLTAEGVTVFVRVPKGSKVVTGGGTGYKGVQPFATLGLVPALQLATHPNEQGAIVRPAADMSGDVVVWKIPKMAAADKLEVKFSLAGSPNADMLKGFEGSAVYWEKPGRNALGQKLAYRDTRTPDKGDHERIPPPQMPAPAKPASND